MTSPCLLFMPMQPYACTRWERNAKHTSIVKAYDLAPEEIDPYLIEGRIYMEEGEYEKGVKRWAKALEYAPMRIPGTK